MSNKHTPFSTFYNVPGWLLQQIGWDEYIQNLQKPVATKDAK